MIKQSMAMEQLRVLNKVTSSFKESVCTHFGKDVFYILDLSTGNFEFITQGFQPTIFGYPVENYYRDGFLFFNPLIHKQDLQKLLANLTLISYRKKEILNVKEKFKLRDASEQWIQVILMGILRGEGRAGRKRLIGLLLSMEYMNTPVSDEEVFIKLDNLYKEFYKEVSAEDGLNNSLLAVLSKRELEVLKLIAEGYSSKMLADKLCISQHTADSHRKNIMSKLRVRNTAEMVSIAARFLQ